MTDLDAFQPPCCNSNPMVYFEPHDRLGDPQSDLCLRVVPLDWGGGGVGPWPVGGWVSLVLGNLAQRAYSPPGGGGLGGRVGGQLGRGWVGPDSPKLTG